MRRFVLLAFFLLFLATLARAQGGGPPVRVTESDGSPAAYPVRRINFPNGTLSCTGSTCTYSGGASGFVSNPSLTSTDNALARFDGTGGVTLQNSTLIVDDTGNVTLGGGATAGELRFLEPSGGGSSYTGFISPALAANVVYTLPTADGSANQVLSTNGSKVLSWATASGGSLYPTMTKPVLADLTWVNQGSSTTNDTARALTILPQITGSTNVHLLKKALPGSSYTVIAAMMMLSSATNFAGGGIMLRESGSGKLQSLQVGTSASNMNIGSNRFTDPNTYSATPHAYSNIWPQGLIWLKYSDNGTTRTLSISYDGDNYATIGTEGHTDFLTPDEAGIFCEGSSSNTSNICTFFSFTVQ